ncbi:hypothetical protein AQUSIP_24210 [Aquicella siphonis]|uniref:Uncharacterized protein n=1 Tax=Aquicella siphonis TaxID=254247 RepID=A0A5E4PJF3_9COXI|nr:hypothetical protein [Aquicella siphonis]VVC77094.1 hypothetical protein AQUSIP_24210 [Aquicella siphonis]
MIKTTQGSYAWLAAALWMSVNCQAFADQTIINNNGQAPASTPPTCNGSYSTSGNGLPPGAYSIPNGDGTSDRLYTTGDKQPYIVDNNCNQSPIIQPYVYAQPPFSGPAPGPGPHPGPKR